jgi:hypothetical protein
LHGTGLTERIVVTEEPYQEDDHEDDEDYQDHYQENYPPIHDLMSFGVFSVQKYLDLGEFVLL